MSYVATLAFVVWGIFLIGGCWLGLQRPRLPLQSKGSTESQGRRSGTIWLKVKQSASNFWLRQQGAQLRVRWLRRGCDGSNSWGSMFSRADGSGLDRETSRSRSRGGAAFGGAL